jgi:hypothetical protein
MALVTLKDFSTHFKNVLNLTILVEGANDINTAWQDWKDAFTTTVSHYIPMRKMKGRNAAPWINGAILTAIRRKESARQKLKSSLNSYPLQQKCKTLRCEVKRMLRESSSPLWQLMSIKARSVCGRY